MFKALKVKEINKINIIIIVIALKKLNRYNTNGKPTVETKIIFSRLGFYHKSSIRHSFI